MSTSKVGWRVIALLTAAGLFWLATRVDFYHATTPYRLSEKLLGPTAPNIPHPWWLALHLWLRKLYSIGAFAAVGLLLQKALPTTSRPKSRAALLVALYSAAIELVQSLVDPYEPGLERAIDIACGAAGGYLGVAFIQFMEARSMLRDHRRFKR